MSKQDDLAALLRYYSGSPFYGTRGNVDLDELMRDMGLTPLPAGPGGIDRNTPPPYRIEKGATFRLPELDVEYDNNQEPKHQKSPWAPFRKDMMPEAPPVSRNEVRPGRGDYYRVDTDDEGDTVDYDEFVPPSLLRQLHPRLKSRKSY